MRITANSLTPLPASSMIFRSSVTKAVAACAISVAARSSPEDSACSETVSSAWSHSSALCERASHQQVTGKCS